MTALIAVFLRRSTPVVIAVALSLAVFASAGFPARVVLEGLIDGSLTTAAARAETIRWATPILIIGLGVLVSFRSGEFNVGGQGQMLIGSLGAIWVSLEMEASRWIIWSVAVALASVLGALWSVLAGFLKVWAGANEVVTTLMLNLIAVQIVQWVAAGSLGDPSSSGSSASTRRIDSVLRWQSSGQISLALVAASAVLVVCTWIALERSEFGLDLTRAGANPDAARWQGLPILRVRLASYWFAGATAGLVGAFEVLGPNGRVVTGATPSLGFTALVAATVGGLAIGGLVIAALLFGALQASVLYLPIVTSLPASGLRVIEGFVAMLVTVRISKRVRNSERDGRHKKGWAISKRSSASSPSPEEPT